jgi:hypothetical protein
LALFAFIYDRFAEYTADIEDAALIDGANTRN